jgi:succinyl-diaminopimelate desuccinylase
MQSLLTKLISFPTVTGDHQATREAFAWIKQQTEALPLHVTDFENGGFPSLLLTTRATKHPKIWLQAHIDVVPAPTNGFTARRDGNQLFGRGSIDMKYAIAAYLTLLTELGHDLTKYDFGVMLTSDEEIGGAHGVKALLEAGYSSDVVLLPDGGSKPWTFVSASRAIWHWQFKATGHPGHGSQPWTGANAITLLIQFLDDLQRLFPSEPCKTPEHFHNSINLGTISGGQATNQIAAHASCSVDMRIIADEGVAMRKQITALLTNYPGISGTPIAEGASYNVNPENNYVKALSGVIKAVRGTTPGFAPTFGSCDARYFAAHRIPTIVFTPAGGGDHSDSEWVDLNDLDVFYKVLIQFVRQLEVE